MLLKDGEWFLLERHLKRLQLSAAYFDFGSIQSGDQKAIKGLGEMLFQGSL